MNNLHRELAPISDAAWAEIEEETTRTLKRYLAGRRVVDVPGPGGVGLAAVGTGHLQESRPRPTASSPGCARSKRWWSSAFLLSWIASRSTTWSGARRIRTGNLPRMPRKRSPSPRTAPSSAAMPRAASAAFARDEQSDHDATGGRASTTRTLLPGAEPVAAGWCQRALSVLLGADAYTALSETRDHGYPVLEHVKRLVKTRSSGPRPSRAPSS